MTNLILKTEASKMFCIDPLQFSISKTTLSTGDAEIMDS